MKSRSLCGKPGNLVNQKLSASSQKQRLGVYLRRLSGALDTVKEVSHFLAQGNGRTWPLRKGQWKVMSVLAPFFASVLQDLIGEFPVSSG